MASGLIIYQSTNKDIVVGHNEPALASATEIEYLIDSEPQIIKKLTAGDISGVTTTSLTVSVIPSDTASLELPGGSTEYAMELRYTTAANKIVPLRVRPNFCKVLASGFA